MIEKRIHYCWFGGNLKGETINKCIESWKSVLPDYEIVEWNESNSDFKSVFCQQALKFKKWAFLSDYIRLKVLFDWGGIYMDTDMLVVKSFDPLLLHDCFLGYQDNGQLNASILGCQKGNGFIKACLNKYEKLKFDETRLMSMAIPEIITEVYKRYHYKQDVSIYNYTYFYPYLFNDSLKGANYMDSIKPETYAVHLWNASWFTEKELAGFAFEHHEVFKGIKLFLIYTLKNPKTILNLPGLVWRKLKK